MVHINRPIRKCAFNISDVIWVNLLQVWRRSKGEEQERPTPRPRGQGPKERGLLRMLHRQIRQPERCKSQTSSSANL